MSKHDKSQQPQAPQHVHNDTDLADAIRQAGQDVLNGLLQVSLALQSLAPLKADTLNLEYKEKQNNG